MGNSNSQKRFVCSKFQTVDVCNYEVTGSEEHVVSEAERHILEEHDYQDGPEGGNFSEAQGLQDMIRASLEDV
ncbi:MAG TPA: DUF1059 domain-containing protein [Ignavibacteria bacterium]|nr:DUF1059 domain-containing protein [Ignavibacteria bacterium]